MPESVEKLGEVVKINACEDKVVAKPSMSQMKKNNIDWIKTLLLVDRDNMRAALQSHEDSVGRAAMNAGIPVARIKDYTSGVTCTHFTEHPVNTEAYVYQTKHFHSRNLAHRRRICGQKEASRVQPHPAKSKSRDLYCEHCHIEHASVESDSDDTLKRTSLNATGPMPDLINDYATIPRLVSTQSAVNRCTNPTSSTKSAFSQENLIGEEDGDCRVTEVVKAPEVELPSPGTNDSSEEEDETALPLSIDQLFKTLKLQVRQFNHCSFINISK